jgi:hypothetical protein
LKSVDWQSDEVTFMTTYTVIMVDNKDGTFDAIVPFDKNRGKEQLEKIKFLLGDKLRYIEYRADVISDWSITEKLK